MNYWIYLFGSFARNEADKYSDLDILLCYDGSVIPNVDTTSIGFEFGKKPNVSIYSIGSIQDYYSKGHLFAWHLFKEAKLLKTNSGVCLLDRIGEPHKYEDFVLNFHDFLQLFDGIKLSVENGQYTYLFEAGNLFTFLRNMYFFVLLKSNGEMNFSPNAIYQTSHKVPIDEEKFGFYRYTKHLRSDGIIKSIPFDRTNFELDISKCKDWMEKYCYEYIFKEDCFRKSNTQ